MNYSTEIKRIALDKMLHPGGASLSAISKEMNIPKDTLYYWKHKAKNGGMSNTNGKKKRSNLRDKMTSVLEARSLGEEELGRWLREKGLHESQINLWEQEIARALENTDGRGGRDAKQNVKIKELERELNRKDKALAEMTALVVLKKKLSAILGEEE